MKTLQAPAQPSNPFYTPSAIPTNTRMPQKSRITSKKIQALQVVGLTLISYFLIQQTHDRGDINDSGFLDLLKAYPAIVAGNWGLKYVKRLIAESADSSRTRGWLMIAMASLIWAGGQVIYSFYESSLKVIPPSPGWQDVFFLSGYCLFGTGLFTLFSSITAEERFKAILDSGVAAGCVVIASWYFIVQKIWHESTLTIIGKLIGTSYPFIAIGLFFAALTMLFANTKDSLLRRSTLYLSIGMCLFVASGAAYTLRVLVGQSPIDAIADWCWILGWISIASASALPNWFEEGFGAFNFHKDAHVAPETAQPDFTQSTLWLLLPYISALTVSAAMLSTDYHTHQHLTDGTFCAVFGVVILVIARQIFTLSDNKRLNQTLRDRLAENKRLTAQLRQFSDGLEQIVDRRARQVGALHQLTRAVHTTQQVDGVIEAASKHTNNVMQGTSIVGIWLAERQIGMDRDTFRLCHIDSSDNSLPGVHRFISNFNPEIWDGSTVVPIMDERDSGSELAGPVAELLYAPLRFRTDVLGILGVVKAYDPNDLRDGAFDQSDRDIIESIGIEVATALQHARQFTAVQNAADRDPVTNLFNHRAIHQRLDEELAIARDQNQPLSVIMMDLNDFKIFNDTYGHPVGDEVLRLVARGMILENPNAIAARYGGDEFIVLIPGANTSASTSFADRLRHRLINEGFQLKESDGQPATTIPIALSFGVAVYPDDCTERQELLALADSNLYKAKKTESGIGVTNTVQRATRKLRSDSTFGILDAMVTSIDNKDSYTRRHSEDVTRFALLLANELRLSDDTMKIIRMGALLHDVGKIGIPEDILRKPGRLTAEEYEVMKKHTTLGAMIVSAVPGTEPLIDAIRSHHEHWDGSGYPDGLAGNDIPMIGRIVAVADAFSAMTTDRVYRAGRDWEIALQEIEKNAGTQFDPVMARAYCAAMRWRLAINGPTLKQRGMDVDSDMQQAA